MANLGYLYLSRVVFTSVSCQHQSSGICFSCDETNDDICRVRCYKHRSLIRIVGMLIAPVINQLFTTSLLSTTVIYDTFQMPICLCPHIPDIPKSFDSHLFCVNIRVLVSASSIFVLSDKNDRPLILSDKNRGNVDNTCHQPVIYGVTVNN